MSNLLQEIRKISEEAASELKSAGFETDSDIRSLNRQDLLELLPGKDQLRVRKKIHERICQLQQQNHKHSVEAIFKGLNEMFPSESSDADALIGNGALLEYLNIHKAFTDKLINILKRNNVRPSEELSVGVRTANSVHDAPASEAKADESKSSMWMQPFAMLGGSLRASLFNQSKQASSIPTTSSNTTIDKVVKHTITPRLKLVTVRYTVVVSGKTLDTHLEVMAKLNGPIPGSFVSLELKEVHGNEDSQVTIVFCPIVSRPGTDVDAALQHVSSDRPIIVVAMYHVRTPAGFPAPKTSSKIHLGVNVFFHETSGLLNCSQNNEAINEVKAKLLEFSVKKSCVNQQ